jgi:hypothetical protein
MAELASGLEIARKLAFTITMYEYDSALLLRHCTKQLGVSVNGILCYDV